jgi:hypothetical protein
MTDIENAVLTLVKNALLADYPTITVDSVTSFSPPKFPCVYIEESDNYSYTPTRDSESNDKYSVVVYEVNAYSNKTSGKKAECKAIMAIVDNVMNGLGFTRTAKTPINADPARYRLFARYIAVVSEDKTIYRR